MPRKTQKANLDPQLNISFNRKRLRAVAIELNVGVKTIVDFLTELKINIKPEMNPIIDLNTYNILLERFKQDYEVKIKSLNIILHTSTNKDLENQIENSTYGNIYTQKSRIISSLYNGHIHSCMLTKKNEESKIIIQLSFDAILIEGIIADSTLPFSDLIVGNYYCAILKKQNNGLTLIFIDKLDRRALINVSNPKFINEYYKVSDNKIIKNLKEVENYFEITLEIKKNKPRYYIDNSDDIIEGPYCVGCQQAPCQCSDNDPG